MRKFFGLALAALLLVGVSFGAQARHTAIIGGTFTAVGSGNTLSTTARGTTTYWFYNGTYDQVVDIQREAGSKGSGAWEVIVKDVFPVANTLYRFIWVTEKDNEQLRLNVRTDTSGTGVYSYFDGRSSPRTDLTRRTHLNRFDDFNENDMALVGDTTWQVEWTAFINAAGTTWGITASIQEGAAEGTAGTTGTSTTNTSALSYGVVANDAALTSDGVTALEVRVRMDDITEAAIFIGLSDTVAIDAAIMPFFVDSGTVVDTGSTDDIGFFFSADATGATAWQPVSTNSGTVGNNAAEFACNGVVANATYETLRIEVEATGDAFWYVDGRLCAAETLAINTDTRNVPYFAVSSSTDDTTGGGILTVDYADFYFPRPSD